MRSTGRVNMEKQRLSAGWPGNFQVNTLSFLRYNERVTDRISDLLKEELRRMQSDNSADLEDLSDFISQLCGQSDKQVVIMIDEVDQAGNQKIFLSFLGMIRRKFLTRKTEPMVSRLCQILDEQILGKEGFPELRQAVYAILFKGEKISFSAYNHVFNLGVMFGFIKEENDNIVISNRIFEMQLYNLFISEELLDSVMYKSAARDKDRNLFIRDGRLDMEPVLVRFTETFK